MGYALFDVVVLALPAALLLRRARPTRHMLAPVAVLALLAVLWTAPWDDYLVRTGVWTYDPAQVLARIGAVPAEEYAFVVLEVVLIAAWGLRTGALRPTPARPAPGRSRRNGAWSWAAAAAAGAVLVLLGGHLRYLGLLLVWAAPPLALQRAVAGDVLAVRRGARRRLVGPVALWLCLADRVALESGLWTVSAGSSTGLGVLGLPVEEALFFLLTSVLVGDGLLLLGDSTARSRCSTLVSRTLLVVRGSHAGGLQGPGPVGPVSRSTGRAGRLPVRRRG
jgi:lycopene beta-cyclase